ncbi:MAG: HIT domain-containing protein [Polyangiaceae bacterium]
MGETIFSEIIRGEIPLRKLYETMVLAFLDINPLSAGHTLVIRSKPWRASMS